MSNPMEIVGTNGRIKVSSEVVLTLIEKVVKEIEGVTLIKSALSKEKVDIAKKESDGLKDSSNKVKEKTLVVNIFVSIAYGIVIPKVIRFVQEKIKEEVEIMTGIQVAKINIFVQTIKS